MKGLERSRKRGRQPIVPVYKAIYPVKALAVAVTDPGAAIAWGTAVLGDLPQGNILMIGAIAYLQFFTASANVIATFNGSFAIGSAPTADATLSGGEIDILAAQVLGAATAKLSPVVRNASLGALAGVILDNTDDSLEVNLNMTIDDASISASAGFVADGFVEILYSVMADD